ncbi:hypothetical protein [Candidatus Hepatobacter penaei]|uniref:hypothetical protein n=1 Tax=Candidatus Hepatobacter penaei TaxID=1274402 RepID=UPI0012E05E33|nr:hypothetical protein [Candidatus Hepatobacter penaei]
MTQSKPPRQGNIIGKQEDSGYENQSLPHARGLMGITEIMLASRLALDQSYQQQSNRVMEMA